ncbi:MAG: gspJ2 [Deltaproteobacteria bacterium]|nr:gspJ2 [Deltaproteobacteria bacterium]
MARATRNSWSPTGKPVGRNPERQAPAEAGAGVEGSKAGFTLIEVVLALTIFALMGAILYGALALGQKAVERTQVSFEKNQQLRAFADLMGSYVRSSHPYRATPQDPAIYYQGEEQQLSFVSASSLALGGRGMALVRVSWQEGERGDGALTLSEELPVRLGEEGGGGGQRNSVVLREGIKQLRFTYLDPQSDGEQWEERWVAEERKVLPRAVRLSYRTDAGKEVRWTFPIMVSLLAQ